MEQSGAPSEVAAAPSGGAAAHEVRRPSRTPTGDADGTGQGTPVALIRAGTSRGVFVRREDLPADQHARDALLLRFFGAQDGELADGLGGDQQTMRKVGIVDRAPSGEDGLPVLTCTFGQVSELLTKITYGTLCGNLAAGIPLFASLHGWCARPEAGGAAWIQMPDSRERIRAEWAPGNLHGGAVRLVFVDPLPRGAAEVLPLGTPIDRFEFEGSVAMRYSVVSAMSDYIFIDGRDAGIPDPVSMDVSAATFDRIASMERAIAARLPGRRSLNVCLVAPVPERAGFVRARIVHPKQPVNQPGFALTGAVTLAVACSQSGTVLDPCVAERGAESLITIEYPGGALSARWTSREDGRTETVSIRRGCRLLLRGLAY